MLCIITYYHYCTGTGKRCSLLIFVQWRKTDFVANIPNERALPREHWTAAAAALSCESQFIWQSLPFVFCLCNSLVSCETMNDTNKMYSTMSWVCVLVWWVCVFNFYNSLVSCETMNDTNKMNSTISWGCVLVSWVCVFNFYNSLVSCETMNDTNKMYSTTVMSACFSVMSVCIQFLQLSSKLRDYEWHK